LVVERPVESDPTPLALALIPDDADVESDPMLLALVPIPEEADVDRDAT